MHATVKTDGRRGKFNFSQNLILAAVLFIIFLIVTLLEPRFASLENIQNIVQQTAVLGIVSLGMNLVMISAGLDLSVGRIIGLSTCVITTLVSQDVSVGLSLLLNYVVMGGVTLLLAWRLIDDSQL